jgi:hypothetical protein
MQRSKFISVFDSCVLTPFSRPVHDFRSLVTPEQHVHLSNFVYIDFSECLAEFAAFVRGLGVKKTQGEFEGRGIMVQYLMG